MTAVIQALYDAADDDSATGGPDLTRRIYPVASWSPPTGTSRMPDGEVGAIVDPSSPPGWSVPTAPPPL